MELKVSEVDNINKFIETVKTTYKDKNKAPDKLFYEIHDDKGVRIGSARKGLVLEDIQKELVTLGEGKYSLVDDQTKAEVIVASDKPAKEEKVSKVAAKSSKTINKNEATMSEERGMMDVVKENGKEALDKMFHGAQVKAAGKTVDALLLKAWAKGGHNEMIGTLLNDPMGRALVKSVLAGVISTVATEKEFAGSEYAKKLAGLVMEGSGGELVEPLMDMVLPILGELISAGKEITEAKFEDLMNKKSNEEEFDAAKEEENLKKLSRKDAKTATA